MCVFFVYVTAKMKYFDFEFEHKHVLEESKVPTETL